MNATRLLEHFERIAEAPDAVPRLRRFILDLAVRGKLVEQDPNDEPAAELLKQIQAERQSVVKKGLIEKPEPLPRTESNEAPFIPPAGWAFVQLQNICTSVTDGDHLPPPKTEDGIPFLVIGNVRTRSIDFSGCRFVSTEYYNSLDRIRKPTIGDILYTLVGSFGIAVPVCDDRPFCVQRHIGILRPSIYLQARFLSQVLESRFVFDQATDCATGIAQKTVPLSGLRRIRIPIPPLAEQHRIAAKVDELMALCNRLEAAQADRECRQDRLVAASLNRLNNGTNAESFREHARFHLRHLPRLTTRPEHIKQLRKTILNLAIRGRLVPQDPNDEPASELLKRIQEVKARLVKEGVIKRHEPPPTIADDEAPFQIPTGWEWTRFIEIAAIQSNLVNPRDYLDSPHIAPDNIESGTGRLLPYETIEASTVFSAKHLFFAGCILYSKIRPALAKAVIVDFSGLCSADMYPILPLLNREYLHRYMLSEVFVKQSISEDTRVAMPKINQVALSKILVAVPPLTEQHRIVAKVEDLMAVCDLLEAQIGITATNSRQLLDVTLRAVLSKVQGYASEVKRGNRAFPTEVGNELSRRSI